MTLMLTLLTLAPPTDAQPDPWAADFAAQRPIETILSGPAASVVGALHLASIDDGVVVDIGGTTTDAAVIRNGRPTIAEGGAVVAGYRR